LPKLPKSPELPKLKIKGINHEGTHKVSPESREIADIGKPKSSPLINTDDTD